MGGVPPGCRNTPIVERAGADPHQDLLWSRTGVLAHPEHDPVNTAEAVDAIGFHGFPPLVAEPETHRWWSDHRIGPRSMGISRCRQRRRLAAGDWLLESRRGHPCNRP